jgi:cytochrome b561
MGDNGMSYFLSPTIENLILVTALINVVAVFLLFFTCRFIPSFKITKPLINKNWFKALYKYHTYLWWLLAPAVLIHAVFAILHKLAGG